MIFPIKFQYQALRNNPPPPLKGRARFSEGGSLLSSDFDSGKIPLGFYFVQKSRAKCRWVFIKFRFWPTQPKVGSHFWSTQICCFPLRNPIFGSPKPQNFLARFARGFLFCPKIFPRFARVFILFIFSSRFSRGFLFCSIFISQKPARVFIEGGGVFRGPW